MPGLAWYVLAERNGIMLLPDANMQPALAHLHVGPGSQEGRMGLGCVCPLLEKPAGRCNVTLMPLQGCPGLQDQKARKVSTILRICSALQHFLIDQDGF